MTWGKLCDTLHAHMKTRRAGLEAMGLWVVSLSWSSQQLTDGFVPEWFVESWPKGKTLARKLVNAGLWDTAERGDDRGWQFHDWEEHNPLRDEIEERKRLNRERQKRFRDKQSGRFAAEDHNALRSALVTRGVPAAPSRPVPSRPEENHLGGDLTTPGATGEPPLHPDHCLAHQSVAEPGPCGSCADARKANRKLAVVPEGYCLVHDSRYWTICSGCEADRKAAQ